MASTTALLTGLSGLTANSRKLDVIGNNIANVNTPAFKANRLLFAPTFSRTLNSGTSPTANSGGSSPTQIGLGVSISGTQRNFSNGGISATGVASDLAIEGDGFFIVDRGGEQFYTRSGAFQLNATRDLVSSQGDRVQGYGVDENFNIVEGNLDDLNVPLGSLTVAEATSQVLFAGNLNTGGTQPTVLPQTAFDQIFQDTGGTPLTPADTLLNNLDDPDNPGVPLFALGGEPYSFTLTGAQKGSKTVPDSTLQIDATTTVQDFLDFLNQSFGIVPGMPNPDGGSPFATSGAQIDAAGNLVIVSNAGESNEITMANTHMRIEDMAGMALANPFTTTNTVPADGESVRTSFLIYDSLGTPVDVDVTMVFESASDAGTTWRYYIESGDNVDSLNPGIALGTGTLQFDTAGRLINDEPISVQVGRENTGAVNPLVFTMDMTSEGNRVTALTSVGEGSALAAVFQDGLPKGTLTAFSVGEDGLITGSFSNGLTRTIGRVALATFTKPEGLVDVGNDLFAVGPNSGPPLFTQPGQFGAGRVVGGALEQSNVDLGQEFIDLVLTTTGYSAASRIITSTDEMLQQLIAIAR